jgi:hypothetical protein
MTRLEVHVKSPMTTHEVTIGQLERWVASTPKCPSDSILKSRVRALLARKAVELK